MASRALTWKSTWIACILFLAFSKIPLAWGGPNDLILADPQGTLYHLQNSRFTGSLSWAPLDPSILTGQEFQRPAGESLSAGGELRVQPGQVEYRAAGGSWTDTGLMPPPGGIQYESAHSDRSGNIYVMLGGRGSGFNMIRAGGSSPILANHMQWSSSAPPNFTQAIGNPYGDGLIGQAANGSLWKIEPPTQPRGPFTATEIAPTGTVKDLVLADGKIAIMTLDGRVGILENGDFNGSFKEISLPKAIKDPAAVRLYSSHESGAGSRIQSLLARMAPPPVALANSSGAQTVNTGPGLPQAPGVKSETRDGIEVRVDKDGKVIPPPASTLADLEGKKPAEAFRAAISRNLTDDVAMDAYLGKRPVYFGREKETDRVLDMLIRLKGANPTLTGEPGVGKTAIAEFMAQKIFFHEIPEALRFESDIKGAVMVETSADAIAMLAKSNDENSQAAAMRQFVESLRASQKIIKRPIVVFLDEAHMLTKAQFNALKPVLDAKNSGIRFIFSTTNREYGLMVQRDNAVERRMPKVNVDEFSPEDTRRLLKDSLVPVLEKEYRGDDGPAKITDDALDQVILRAREYAPNSAFPESPIKLLMDTTTRQHHMSGRKAPVINGSAVGKFVQEELNLPFDPTDPEFDSHLDRLKEDLHKKVVEQESVTDGLVDMFRDIIDTNGGKTHRVTLIEGPTGAGKTFGAEEALKLLVGPNRMLVIDGTKYANAGNNLNIIMNDLLGAPPGVISSDQTRGVLPEFLSGRGRGLNGIVLNEVDKMDPGALKRLMEMFDKGVLEANDGKSYRLGRSLIVMTTNKGSERIYPRGHGASLTREELVERVEGFSQDELKGFFLQPDPKNLYDTSKQLPPEVVQRIDHAWAVLPPTAEGAFSILKNEAALKQEVIAKSKGYQVTVDDDVLKMIIRTKYSPENGVREPIRVMLALVDEARAELRRKTGKIAPEEKIRIALMKGDLRHPDQIEVIRASSPEPVTMAIPDLKNSPDPLQDPKRRQVLQTLESRLAKHVFGQEEAIADSAESIRNQYANPLIEQPYSSLDLGPTGTGKTEMAKAIARELFGSEDRALILNMGEVANDYDYNNIFNPPKGVAGSESMSQFEQFLAANKGAGGVIVLDEIGNMGGGDPRRKGELLKKFYKMLDEGVYRNPVTGEEYDLRKFVFRMTSNEMQEYFANAPSDDLRQAVWREKKLRPQMEEYLKQNGWPEALLARIDQISLYRPSTEPSRIQVAKKFFKGLEDGMKSISGIKGLEADDRFWKSFQETFYSHAQGARVMRTLTNKGAVSSLINKARFELEPQALEGATLHFSMEDNYSGQYRFRGPAPPERQVFMHLKVMKDGKEIASYSTPNLKDKAAQWHLQSTEDIRRTAFHETGHFLANDPKLTGQATDFITIRGMGQYGGYARYKDVYRPAMTRKGAIAQIAVTLGGVEGEKAMGMSESTGWSSDLEQARKMAENLITRGGMTEHALELPTKDGKVIVENPKVQKEISKLLDEGRTEARRRIRANWEKFRLTSAALLRAGHLTAEGIGQLEEKLRTKSYRHPAQLKPRHQGPLADAATPGTGDSTRLSDPGIGDIDFDKLSPEQQTQLLKCLLPALKGHLGKLLRQ